MITKTDMDKIAILINFYKTIWNFQIGENSPKFQFSCHSDFYMKFILVDFRSSKTVIFVILEALNFDFWGFHNWKCQNFPKIQHSLLPKWSNWQVLGLQESQNWFHVKSEWQQNPAIFTLWSPIVNFNHISYFSDNSCLHTIFGSSIWSW